MSAPRISLALLALLLAAALTGCASSQSAADSQVPSSVTSPIGGAEGGSSVGSTVGSAGAAASAAGVSSATSPAMLGAQIFSTGNLADGTSVAVTSGSGGPCAHCHGSDASGIVGPDIRWSVLTGAQSSARSPRFTLKSIDDFGKAVTTGVASGNQLKPLMPHYQLSTDQIAALAAYLKTL